MIHRVLVVDDHPAVALALKVFLRGDERFAITDSAGTAAEGLERLDGHDAVVLDFQLPDLSGPELVRAFRVRAPQAALILHTAADDTPAVEAVRALVDAVVPKSTPEAVLSALEGLIGA